MARKQPVAGADDPEELLDALTEFVSDKLSGDTLAKLVHVEVGHALAAAEQLTLGEVVTPQQVSGAAIKYALEWRIEGAIPELAGDIAGRIHERLLHDNDARDVAVAAEKFLAMPAFHRIIDLVYHSPAVRGSVAWFLYRAAVESINRNRDLMASTPGLGMLVRLTGALGNRVAPAAPAHVDRAVRGAVERIVAGVLDAADTPDLAIPRPAAGASTAELLEAHIGSSLTAQELEDLLVLGFEIWNDMRGTRALRAAVEEGVAVFFQKYSHYTLADLLDELGVSREDMIEEALRFAPRVLGLVQENGMLESFVRRQFRDFVESERVRRLLS